MLGGEIQVNMRSLTEAWVRVEQLFPSVGEGRLATLWTKTAVYLPSLRLHGGLQKWGGPQHTLNPKPYFHLYYRDPKVSSSF